MFLNIHVFQNCQKSEHELSIYPTSLVRDFWYWASRNSKICNAFLLFLPFFDQASSDFESLCPESPSLELTVKILNLHFVKLNVSIK